MILFQILVGLLLDVLPLGVFLDRIVVRAEEARVSPDGYVFVAVAGWLVGVPGGHASLPFLMDLLFGRRVDDNWLVLVAVLAGGFVGGAIAPALSYTVLRMRTARDPDYGPLAASDGQQVADRSAPVDDEPAAGRGG